MLGHLGAIIGRIDAIYAEQPYFVRLKARLLAWFQLASSLFLALNFFKLCWLGAPGLSYRLTINLCMQLAVLLSWRWLRRGRLGWAVDGIVLASVLPVHVLLLFLPNIVAPLAATIQLFIFDFLFLLLALIFASRQTILVVLTLSVVGLIVMRMAVLGSVDSGGAFAFAADTILREGLIAIAVVFCLGWQLKTMIEATHRRSEEALRATLASKQELEQLVSERTRDLEAATSRANEASRAKGDFLANMSHEIRTPLNGIIASADLLCERTDLPPEVAERARLIGESGELLLRLLGDILDFSKIEAGRLVLEPRPFALAPLVRDAVGLLAPQAREGDVALTTTLASDLPTWVEGDGFRLRQILLNLLSNAIKFTPEGGRVSLEISADDPVANPATLRVVVRDSGIGMSAETLSRVFQRFTQADSSTTRRYGGTGLGLSITSRLVDLMGGTLEATSVEGEGSIFTCRLRLPLAVGEEPVPVAGTGAPDALGLDVLLAEDNAVNRRVLSAQLARLGCHCSAVPDGQALLDVLAGDLPLPDVILMDCHMPRLDGWDATERLRHWASESDVVPRLRAASALPVVALTAAVLPEERARCLAVGMNDFLAKPMKLAELHAALKRAASSHKSDEGLSRSA